MGFDMGYIDEEMLASWGKESEMNEKLADPANKENFKMVDPRDIQPFRDHTFQVRDDEEMKELRDSIRANGILQPLLVYWNEEWELEMISGHRRRQAAIDLRLKEVPVIVMHVNRETATLLMGESNLRTREKLLPSEKGFTYKAMMEALRKKPGVRLDASFRDRTRELLAKNLGQSGRQIQKYINITKLISELLNLVDEGRIGICPADVMSRLPEYVQKLILEYYKENDVTPNHGQVIKMVEMQKEKPLTKEAVYELLAEPKGNQIYIDPHLFFRSRVVAAMLKDCTTSAEMERRAIFAIQLLNWYEKYLIKNGTDPRRVDFVIRDIMNQDVE